MYDTRGCFTNVSRALQNIISKFPYSRHRTSYENFKLKLCTCAQSHALGTRRKLQLEVLTINEISGIIYFREIILENSRNVTETNPRGRVQPLMVTCLILIVAQDQSYFLGISEVILAFEIPCSLAGFGRLVSVRSCDLWKFTHSL